MIAELRELTPGAKLRYIKNLGNGWSIKTSNEFVLIKDPGVVPGSFEDELAKYCARLRAEP